MLVLPMERDKRLMGREIKDLWVERFSKILTKTINKSTHKAIITDYGMNEGDSNL